MHASPTVRLWADDDIVAPPKVFLFQLVRSPQFGDPLRRALSRGRQALLARQELDGNFADPRPLDGRSLATLVLARAFLEDCEPGQHKSASRALLDLQQADGGWSTTATGDLDISATVLAYFALKLCGQASGSEPMVCARRAILAAGGATKIDSLAKTWLALFGQMSFDAIDATFTESLWMPKGGRATAPGSFAQIESLTQWILGILRPRRHIRTGLTIRELFLAEPRRSGGRFGSAMQWAERRLRKPAISRARKNLLTALRSLLANPTDQEASVEPLAMLLVTLDVLGYVATSELRGETEKLLASMIDLDADVAAFKSPATGLTASIRAAMALVASGLDAGHSSVGLAVSWILKHSTPSTTQAAMLLNLLTGRSVPDTQRDTLPPPLRSCADDDDVVEAPSDGSEHIRVLVGKIFTAQLSCGAWPATLDKRGARTADLGATAAAVMALCTAGAVEAKNGLDHAADWLRSQQQADGSWPATASCTAIQSTSLVIRALIAATDDPAEQTIAAGVDWLLAHQQSDGGWGDVELGQTGIAGEGTSSSGNTAAALSALVAAGQGGSGVAARGADLLLSALAANGTWPNSTQSVDASHPCLTDTAEAVMALADYAVRRPTPATHDNPRLQIAQLAQD